MTATVALSRLVLLLAEQLVHAGCGMCLQLGGRCQHCLLWLALCSSRCVWHKGTSAPARHSSHSLRQTCICFYIWVFTWH